MTLYFVTFINWKCSAAIAIRVLRVYVSSGISTPPNTPPTPSHLWDHNVQTSGLNAAAAA